MRPIASGVMSPKSRGCVPRLELRMGELPVWPSSSFCEALPPQSRSEPCQKKRVTVCADVGMFFCQRGCKEAALRAFLTWVEREVEVMTRAGVPPIDHAVADAIAEGLQAAIDATCEELSRTLTPERHALLRGRVARLVAWAERLRAGHPRSHHLSAPPPEGPPGRRPHPRLH